MNTNIKRNNIIEGNNKSSFFHVNSCDGIWGNTLDIRFTKACDNDCSFCIEKTGAKAKRKISGNEMAISSLKCIKDNNIENILILGGEPLLYIKDVLEYIKYIKKHSDVEIYLTTSLPNTINKEFDTMVEILSLLNGLNISLHHYDDKINNKILKASSNHSRTEILQKLCNVDNSKIRVAVNPCVGNIDNKKEFLKYVSELKEFGVLHIKIQELQNASEQYVNFEKMMNIKLQEAYGYGCQTDISEILKDIDYNIFNNMKITLKRSCFFVEDSLDISYKAFLKLVVKEGMKKTNIKKNETNTFVQYENGDIANGWE